MKGIQFQSSMQAEAQMQNMISLNKLGNQYMQQAVGSINKGQVGLGPSVLSCALVYADSRGERGKADRSG